jgi:hypothetical protein
MGNPKERRPVSSFDVGGMPVATPPTGVMPPVSEGKEIYGSSKSNKPLK